MITDKPIGLIITWSVKMLTEGGASLKDFMYEFESMNEPDGGAWFQKCSKKPKHIPLYCYIIIGGRIMYRANISHYETGTATIKKCNQMIGQIEWPRLVLTAPIIKAPHKIPMRGFQGFRYTHEQIF